MPLFKKRIGIISKLGPHTHIGPRFRRQLQRPECTWKVKVSRGMGRRAKPAAPAAPYIIFSNPPVHGLDLVTFVLAAPTTKSRTQQHTDAAITASVRLVVHAKGITAGSDPMRNRTTLIHAALMGLRCKSSSLHPNSNA